MLYAPGLKFALWKEELILALVLGVDRRKSVGEKGPYLIKWDRGSLCTL